MPGNDFFQELGVRELSVGTEDYTDLRKTAMKKSGEINVHQPQRNHDIILFGTFKKEKVF